MARRNIHAGHRDRFRLGRPATGAGQNWSAVTTTLSNVSLVLFPTDKHQDVDGRIATRQSRQRCSRTTRLFGFSTRMATKRLQRYLGIMAEQIAYEWM